MKFKHLKTDGNKNLYSLLDGEIPQAVCCGRGTCGKCKVRVLGDKQSLTDAEKSFLSVDEIEAGYRLACYYVPEAQWVDLEVPDADFTAVSSFMGAQAGNNAKCTGSKNTRQNTSEQKMCEDESSNPILHGLAVALDLGTTTLAASLVDKKTGRVLSTASCMNSQRKFGADVLLRIDASTKGYQKELQRLVIKDIIQLINNLLVLAGSEINTEKDRQDFIEQSPISEIFVSANTLMSHLLLALPSEGLGVSPFTPKALSFEPIAIVNLLSEIEDYTMVNKSLYSNAILHLLPCADAFVGSDVFSGLIACAVQDNPLPALYLDLGTNAEMVLITHNGLWCSSAAAGPAFEGGHVSCGSGSVPGAISSVRLQGATFTYTRIPQADKTSGLETHQSIGLCGTGLLDFLASAKQAGLIKRDGSLARVCESTGVILDPALELRLSAQDVRELQLAIAAVRAGIRILLDKAQIQYKDIAHVYLAGGFAFYLSETSALSVGLLDQSFAHKITPVGNASLAGSIQALVDPDFFQKMHKALTKTQSIYLAHEDTFNSIFLESMEFPEYD